MNRLYELIKNNEEWLIDRVLDYAVKHNYVRYTSTLREAWRKSINDLSDRILVVLQYDNPVLELNPDIDFNNDSVASYGILQAQKHRERGVDVAMFLGLFKYYRQSYIDLVMSANFELSCQNKYRLIIDRFFDRIEIGLSAERVEVNQSQVFKELQFSNRVMTNEKNKYLTIFESLPNPIIIFDSQNCIDNMNHAAAELFYPHFSTPGVSYYGLDSGKQSLPWLVSELTKFTKGDNQEFNFTKALDTKKGILYFRIKLKRMLDISGKYTGTVVMLTDITIRKKAVDALRNAHKELNQIFNTAASAMRLIDKNFNVLRVNSTFANLVGISPAEAVGKKCYQIFKGEFCYTPNCPLTRIINGEKRLEYDVEKERYDGVKIPCTVTATPFLSPKGELLGIVEDFRDISERKQIEQQLKYMSLHDPLTGLYNRTFFDQEINLLEKGYSDPVGVIVCDVDGLKKVNDTFGHDAGDELLRAAATVIKNSFRKDDIVARIGGDEFVVLLPNSDHETVKDSYDRIKNGIALYNGANPKLPLSISVGFAIKDGADASLNDTFKQADNNMYIEKRAKKRIVKGKFAL